MPPTTHLPPLPEKKRRFIFFLMAVSFLVAVPLMVFYAVGYRFDFSGNVYDFKAVGGLYISTPASENQIFVDGELIDNLRIFRSAAYIQDLEAGVHEVNVQQDGLQTWVKELPVFAHLVTEAQSFNMPERPQVRLLTPWSTDAGIGVVFNAATSTDLSFASTTNLLLLATSTTATSSLNEDLEYQYIVSRFASSSAEAAQLATVRRLQSQPFSFASELLEVGTTTATTTKQYRDSILYESGGEVYISWVGRAENIPYYYCLTNEGSNLTAQLYGSHVYRQLLEQTPSTTDLSAIAEYNQRFCRDTIRIDRLWQEVHWFDFMPDSEDLVLMHLDDGLYVVEADDRSWQNTQLLYPGTDLEVLIDGGRIFVHDREYFLEVLTELPQ